MRSNNKSITDFSGINEESGLKTIGFRFGSYVKGTTNVGSVYDLPHVSDTMKNIVKVLFIGIRNLYSSISFFRQICT